MFYGKFTQGAQRALQYAQDEARALGHNYIGTEHVLLGLIKETDGAASKILRSNNIGEESVRRRIISLIGKGDFQFNEQFGMTPRTKKVMELAVAEAKNLGHSYVGTEHILLALMRERDGVAARILMEHGVNLNQARDAIVKKMHEEPSEGNPAATVSPDKTPTLNQFSRDLTQAAKDGELDPVIGRAKEIERIIQILSRRRKNNPVLIGEPGVGKSAVVEGLAQQIAEGNVPELIKNKRVVSLDLSGMVAGAKYRGEFEERLKTAMDEITKAGNVILFIDEIHTVVGTGAAEGSLDAANILKPMLARGEMQTIGATTLDEYRRHIEKDAALERRFQPVNIGEPTKEEAVQILYGLRDRYEAHHKVRITDEAIHAAVQLSDRYIADRFLPDKAIDLIDEASSRVRIRSFITPPDMKDIENRMEALAKEKEEAVNNQNFERAASLRDEERRLGEEREQAMKEWKESQSKQEECVTEDDIADVVYAWTSIPVSRLTEGESERLMNLEKILHKRIVGQNEAVEAVARAIRRASSGLKDPNRPIGSFIFLGPTGVGKSELSKALAEAMFGDENAIIRLDMSEYMERHNASRMVGSPPGYVGYDDGGQLTEAVRRKPYSVILLDEIEKAHPDVFNILLQILEDGRLTDSKGRTIDFRNTILIMTSNVGASTMHKQKAVGFGTTESAKDKYDAMRDNVMEELKKTFRPEFINRIDETIVFHELDKDDILQISGIMLDAIVKRLEDRDIHLTYTDDAKEKLSYDGYDPVYGARPLRRAIQRSVEDALSEEIISGRIHIGDRILMDAKDGELVFSAMSLEKEPAK